MPYLEPDDESLKAQEYFGEHEQEIAERLDETIVYFDEVRCFISKDDNQPYIVVVLRSYCPWGPHDPHTYALNEVLEGFLKSYRAFPELTHSPIYLSDMFDFVVVKRKGGGQSSFEKLLWPNELEAPEGDEEYE
ncbi:hypothetical protein F4776DRAFT_666877 [Hypoxylon sp. NC0597]|nr:hypothetical protein F4776DRAFT_666877 [Hypoxylon sp. NC0597]